MKYWKTLCTACYITLGAVSSLPLTASPSLDVKDPFPFFPRVFIMDKGNDQPGDEKIQIVDLNKPVSDSTLLDPITRPDFEFNIDSMAFNKEFSQLYVMNSGSNKISIITLDPNSEQPAAGANVSPFNLSTENITSPTGLALSPTGTELYISSNVDTPETPKIYRFTVNPDPNAPLTFDKSFGENTKLLNPTMLAFGPDENTLYALSVREEITSGFLVFTRANAGENWETDDQLIQTTDLKGAYGMCYHPTLKKLFILTGDSSGKNDYITAFDCSKDPKQPEKEPEGSGMSGPIKNDTVQYKGLTPALDGQNALYSLAVASTYKTLAKLSFTKNQWDDGPEFVPLWTSDTTPPASDVNPVFLTTNFHRGSLTFIDEKIQSQGKEEFFTGTVHGENILTWTLPVGAEVTGYEIFRDGNFIVNLGKDATSWTDPSGYPEARYEIIAQSSDGTVGGTVLVAP